MLPGIMIALGAFPAFAYGFAPSPFRPAALSERPPVIHEEITTHGRSEELFFQTTRTPPKVKDGIGGCYEETLTLRDEDGNAFSRETRTYKRYRLDAIFRENLVTGEIEQETYFVYNGLGLLKERHEVRNGELIVHVFDYDDQFRLASYLPPDKAPQHLEYDGPTHRVAVFHDSESRRTRYVYDAKGRLKETYGGGVIQSAYAYDEQSRLTKLTTLKDGRGVETEWIYKPETGLLHQKKINGRLEETYYYNPNGMLARVDRHGEDTVHDRAPGTPDLSGINVPGDADAGVTIAERDRPGNPTRLETASGPGLTRTYGVDGRLVTEDQGIALASNVYHYQGLTRIDLIDTGGTASIHFDSLGGPRVRNVRAGAVAVDYDYLPQTDWIETQTFNHDENETLVRRVKHDENTGRIEQITYTAGGVEVAGFGYGYDPDSDRICAISNHLDEVWRYTYDMNEETGLRQIHTGRLELPDGTFFPGSEVEYSYDEIGNLLRIDRKHPRLDPETLLANSFNVITERINDDHMLVYGTVMTGATVTVNHQPTTLNPDTGWFEAVVPVDNAQAVASNLTIMAVWFDHTQNVDIVKGVTGSAHRPAATETMQNELTGELDFDSRFNYNFNDLGLFREVTSKHLSNPITFRYDYKGPGSTLKIQNINRKPADK